MLKYILIALLLVVVAAILYGGYFMFTSVFDNHYKGEENNDPDFLDSQGDLMRPTARKLYAYRDSVREGFRKQNFEEIDIKARDGLRLHGQLVERDPKEIVICVHGYKSNPEDDFCDRYQIYQDRGSTVLFVHCRYFFF